MIVRRTKDAAEGRLSLLVYSEVCCRSHSYFEDVAERSEQKLDKRTILFSRGLSAELGTNFPLLVIRLRSGLTLAMFAGSTSKDSPG
jgi:hypothetical protein